MASGALCARHSQAVAGWRCDRCGSALCPACAAYRKAGQGIIEVCGLCGGIAPPIRVRRAAAQPFGIGSLWQAVRWPFHREGLITTAACAAVFWLLSLAGMLAGLLAFGVILAVLFHITTSTARGEDEFREAGDFRGFFEHVAGPLARALFASAWAYAPVLAFFFWRQKDLNDFTLGENLAALHLIFWGTFLFPCGLLVAATGTPMRQILNPLLVIGTVVKLGRDYLLISAFALAISLAESALLRLIGTGLVQDALLLLPAQMLFRALGLLVRARGDELGYGGAAAYLVPVLGDQRPGIELQPKTDLRSTRGA